jgi:hypothetical protein
VSPAAERRALQIAVALGSLVPIGGGLAGVLLGPDGFAGHAAWPTDLDSHVRYLSGLLLAIGLAYASAVPGIARRRRRFRLLCFIVVVGGLSRLLSLLFIGMPSPVMLAALGMELLVTPALTLWQDRVARMPEV